MLGFTPWRETARARLPASVSCSASARSCGPSCRRATPSPCCAASTTRRPTLRRRAGRSRANASGSPACSTSRSSGMSLGQRMRCEIVASLLHAPRSCCSSTSRPSASTSPPRRRSATSSASNPRDEGQTVVLTSHDTRDIELVCERVIVINAGRIVVDQPTEQLRRQFLARKLVTLRSAAPSLALEHARASRAGRASRTPRCFEVDTRGRASTRSSPPRSRWAASKT